MSDTTKVDLDERVIVFEDDNRFEEFAEKVREGFAKIKANYNCVFQTDAEGLFEAYLDNLPEEAQQYYNCDTCRSFINRYGDLVAMDKNGETFSVMWDYATHYYDGFFKDSVVAMSELVNKASIKRPFIADTITWGTPTSGTNEKEGCDWNHLYVQTDVTKYYNPTRKTSGQIMADYQEQFLLIKKAIELFDLDIAKKVRGMFKKKILVRPNKFLPMIEAFIALKEMTMEVKHEIRRENLTWLHLAQARKGFGHFKNGILGTIITDIQEEECSIDDAIARFNRKANEKNYQMTDKELDTNDIELAERVMAEYELEKSFSRKFIPMSEVELIWKPVVAEPEPEKKPGLFDKLKETVEVPENKEPTEIHQVVTKASRDFKDILEEVVSIEVLTKDQYYIGMLAPLYPDEPKIFRDQGMGQKTSYNYPQPVPPTIWNLDYGWTKVVGITNMIIDTEEWPLLILEDCKDLKNTSNNIFPEDLISDLRDIRWQIQALSKITPAHEDEDVDQFVAGVVPANIKIRVVDNSNLLTTYQLVNI